MMAAAADRPKLTVTPSAAIGSGSSGTVTTDTVTATVTPGSGYSFLWSYFDGDPTINPSLPVDSSSQRWSGILGPGQDKTATWSCTAYLGATIIASELVTVFIQRF